MRHVPAVVLSFVVLSVMNMSNARAQCDNSWEPGPLSAPLLGADGPIYAVWSWSLPGDPAQLIVGGDFTHIGGIAANNVAAWDGQFWHALGSGLSKPVYALTTYNFALIAGGEGAIAAWNGSAWTSFGTPLPTFNGGQYPSAYALAVFNGELYAGGDFDWIDNNPGPTGTGNLWKYNGTTWTRVFAGVGSAVRALQVFDDDGGGPHAPALYIGGESTTTSLRKWDGTTATSIAGPYANTLGTAGSVYCLTVVNAIGPMSGGLIVGGNFFYAPSPGGGGNFPASNVARFDGTNWQAMAGGVTGAVSALRAFGTDLYVGGTFAGAGTGGGAVTANNIARFNGSQWFSVGGGIGAVKELREFGGQLVVAGSFASAGGGAVLASNVARWSGASWSNFAEPFSVNALARLGSRIIMGGSFNAYTLSSFPTTITNRSNIITWDMNNNPGGLGWGTNGNIRALTAYTSGSGPTTSNIIVAGGDFTSCGPDQSGFGIAVNRVAMYVEPSLTLPGWSAMGSGFNGSVNALDRFFGNTVAGGSFTASGATAVSRLAKYTGSPASWQPLTSPDPGLNGTVWAMKTFQTSPTSLNYYLTIGGDFTSAPGAGVAASRIIQRVETSLVGQSAWQALGSGFNGSVYAIERYGSGLSARTYAAGAFTASGATTLNRIARWNNTSWEVVGNGTGFNGAVYALKSAGAYLFAAGAFTSVDGIAVNRVAKWNGTTWSDASGGASDLVYALMPFQTELIAGGPFLSVQSGAVNSPGMARLKASGVPWILSQPLSQTRNCQEPVYFEVHLPGGYETATYQWRKDGVPLTDGPTGTGSQVVGAQNYAMSAYSLSPFDNGSYDCVITNACGSVTSTAATLTVNSCCVADIAPIGALDGQVNVADLLAVITAWGTCASCTSCPADIAPAVHDCQVNVADLLAVITNWGPCP